MLLLLRHLRRFTPRSLGGLVAWYDATRITGLADGAAVAQWDDLSGNGNHATQATGANRPSYQTNEINGRPVVRFVRASTHYLSADAVAASLTGTDVPFTVIAVVRRTDATLVHEIAAAARSTSTVPLAILRTNSTGWQGVRRDDANVAVTLGGVTVNTTPHILSYSFAGTTGTVRLDGVVLQSAAQDVGTLTLNTFTLGAGNVNGAIINPLDGDLADVIVYNRALSTTEQRQIERYLSRKYGVAVT